MKLAKNVKNILKVKVIPNIVKNNYLIGKNQILYKFKKGIYNYDMIEYQKEFCWKCSGNHCVGCFILDFLEFIEKKEEK